MHWPKPRGRSGTCRTVGWSSKISVGSGGTALSGRTASSKSAKSDWFSARDTRRTCTSCSSSPPPGTNCRPRRRCRAAPGPSSADGRSRRFEPMRGSESTPPATRGMARFAIGLSRKTGGAAAIAPTHSFTNPNFKAMPRKKVKAHKKTSVYKVFCLIDRNNFEYERNFRKSHLQNLWNWTHSLYNVLPDRPHIIKRMRPVP